MRNQIKFQPKMNILYILFVYNMYGLDLNQSIKLIQRIIKSTTSCTTQTNTPKILFEYSNNVK